MRNFIKKLFIVFFLLNVGNNYPSNMHESFDVYKAFASRVALNSMYGKFGSYLWNNEFFLFCFSVGLGGLFLRLRRAYQNVIAKRELKEIEEQQQIKQTKIEENKELAPIPTSNVASMKDQNSFYDALVKRMDYVQIFQNRLSHIQVESLEDLGLRNRIIAHKGLHNGITMENIAGEINNTINIDSTEIISSVEKKYKEKMLERRERYLEEIRQQIKVDYKDYLPIFNQDLDAINKIIKYIRYFYLRPITASELKELNIEKTPLDMFRSNEKHEDIGEKLVQFIDNFFTSLGINPWNVMIYIVKEVFGHAVYHKTFGKDEKNHLDIVAGIRLDNITILLNPENIKFHMQFLNTIPLTYLLGGLFEGHQFFSEITPVELRKTKNYLDLEQCFFVEATTTLITKNKSACFEVLKCHMFNCIAQKHTGVNMFETGGNIPSLAERLIHTFDAYFQVHKPEEKTYNSFQEETKSDLFKNLKIYEKHIGNNLQKSINYFLDEKNYPQGFQLMVPRIILDIPDNKNETYSFLPKYLPSK